MSLKKYFYLIALLFLAYDLSPFRSERKKFVIMLDPAGDAHRLGRVIGDCFERGITLQAAESLKQSIQGRYENVYVVLSRSAGDFIEPLQIAHFANRFAVDLYISINFYEEKNEKGSVFIYQFINDLADYWQSFNDNFFVRYDQAHKKLCKKISTLVDLFTQELKYNNTDNYYEIKGSFGIPFKQLIGINRPAFALEIGLKDKNDWRHYIDPLVTSLKPIIEDSSIS